MLYFFLATLLFTNLACHEPCKNGYGRAADNLCYRLADDPEAPCGDGMARTDEGVCVSVTDADDPYATAGATDGSGSGGTDGGSSGGSDEVAGDETGGIDASGDGSGTTTTGGEIGGGEIGGGEIGGGGGPGVGTTTGGDASGSATLKGVLNTSDGTGFAEGDEVLIQAWSEDTIDAETGWPADGASPRATQFAGAAVTAISIHFEFIVTDILEEGENLRLTAHLTDDPLDVESAPMGVYPLDPSSWVRVLPGERAEDINIVIDNGGDVSAPPGGEPTDTGLPPLDGGGDPDLGSPT